MKKGAPSPGAFLLMEVSGLEIFVQQTINLKMSKARWNEVERKRKEEEVERYC